MTVVLSPIRFRDRKPDRDHHDHGIWYAAPAGWATVDLTPAPGVDLSERGRYHRTMGDALAYLDEADRFTASSNPTKARLLSEVYAGDAPSLMVLADLCEAAGLGEVSRAFRAALASVVPVGGDLARIRELAGLVGGKACRDADTGRPGVLEWPL